MRASILGKLGAAVAFTLGVGAAVPGGAFTQSVSLGPVNAVPMGHEWLTRMSAIELLGYSPASAPDLPDPNDPRRGWTVGGGKAWNTVLNGPGQAEAQRIRSQRWNDTRYASRYKAVYDAIIGERWVDLAGYSVAESKKCWDAVAQEPAEVQYDHFMRRYDDNGPDGGVRAAKTSQQRFVDYFVAAATAPKSNIAVYDGGVTSSLVTVDRNYFLFGRAVHLFQDSFSSEHTVRIASDNYLKVREVKSYLCALGSEQHSHSNWAVAVDYSSGDVIWKATVDGRLNPSWDAYKASNMKPTALVATEASKDLWAAFIRTMGLPPAQRAAAARAEANTLVKNWLSYDETEMRGWYANAANRGDTYVLAAGQTGKGMTQAQCMSKLDFGTTDQAAAVRQLQDTQRQCLYNALPNPGYEDQFDPQTRIWYNWRWRNGPIAPMSPTPAGWQIPTQPASTSTVVRIQSVANGKYMIAPDGVVPDSLIYNRDGTPLDFARIGPNTNTMFRSAQDPMLFLDYRALTGAVKLFAPGNGTQPATYDLQSAGQGTSIRNTYWNQYIWLSGDEPYLTRTGNPKNANAQWRIQAQP